MIAAIVQEKAGSPARLVRVLKRTLFIVLLGFAIGWILHRAEVALEKRNEPAGFVHGMVQGALMPMSLPNFLIGDNVMIYAARNSGRSYNLGYTLGVNCCGLVFFGLFFWRLQKLKRLLP